MNTPFPELGLSPTVSQVLAAFCDAAERAFGQNLKSVVLYGSAAEGRLRPTSDVNVIIVLSQFIPSEADALREPLRLAHAAIRLDSMFLLEAEIPQAVEAFADKFSDVLRRRKVLRGADVFAQAQPERQATVARLRQALLNLTLRLRHAYVERSLREEQLARAIAEAAGPLRSAAATLLELEGRRAASPKEALSAFAAGLSGNGWPEMLEKMSEARERTVLPPGMASPVLLKVMELTQALRTRAQQLH